MHLISARNMEHGKNGYNMIRLFTVGAICFGINVHHQYLSRLLLTVRHGPLITRLEVHGFTSLFPPFYVHTTVRIRRDLPCIHHISSLMQLCNNCTSNGSVCVNMLVTLISPLHVFAFKIVTCNGLECF
jgi:hypothetical protein